MAIMKTIFIIAITMAISIAVMVKVINHVHEKTPLELLLLRTQHPSSTTTTTIHKEEGEEEGEAENNLLALPSLRGSRFLAQASKNHSHGHHGHKSAAGNCTKNNKVCHSSSSYGKNSTCCNHTCVLLSTDDNNCGKCKKKCKFGDVCCGGKCVNLKNDKKNCGKCGNHCKKGHRCELGMCNYA